MSLTKKCILFIALLFSIYSVLLGFMSNTVKADANNPTKLIIHYFRYDKDYTTWDLWLWQHAPVDGAGKNYSLDTTQDAFGSKTVIDLAGTNLDGATSVGILIKDSNWNKDIAKDRFIDLTHPDSNGEVNVYFVQSDERMGYSIDDSNGPDKSDKVLSAYFKNQTTISFSITSPITESEVKVYKGTDQLTPDHITLGTSGSTGTIVLNENVDVKSSYSLNVNFTSGDASSAISFNGLYDTQAFKDAFTYTGNDLGANYTKTNTVFKLWAPISTDVQVCLYDTGAPSSIQTGGDDTPTCTDMVKGEYGIWTSTVSGDLNGQYYTFKVTNGTTTNEVVDPYAVSTGVNGIRGMVLDLNSTNPSNWDPTYKPNNMTNPTDAIIYELNIRDLTSSSTWAGNEDYRGKFMGLTEKGTTYKGVSTGLDHLIDLGITHVQLMPVFDFGAIDERTANTFNWGYMPMNYNVPEGSFATDPYHGEVRVNEFKQMVDTLHNNNIRVIMDVVYNHTGLSQDSNFNEIVPGYYYRMTSNGGFSNGSGTGNELASERSMVSKFILDSVKYWVDEYDIDGFRFDLMALEDKNTMTKVAQELHQIDPTILVYGEPWTGGTSTLPSSQQSDKNNLMDIPGVGAFNDDTRDGIKGPASDSTTGGFIQGQFEDNKEKVEYGILGGISNPILGNYNVWHGDPNKTINYVACHDNNTLFDKLRGSLPNYQYDQLKLLQKQANGIVLTSQGIPFIQEGADFMRTKGGDDNSYQSPDSVNQLDWALKSRNMDVYNYYKGMIALRKAHPAFRMTTANEINQNLNFIQTNDDSLIEYTINNNANNDTWDNILVIDNGNSNFKRFNLPEGEWNLVANQDTAGTDIIRTVSGQYTVRGNETLVFYQGETIPDNTTTTTTNDTTTTTSDNNSSDSQLIYIIGGALVAIIIVGLGIVYIKKGN